DFSYELNSFKVEGELGRGIGTEAPVNKEGLSNKYAQGGIETNDYVNYRVLVETAGTYTVTFSYCNGTSTNIDLIVGGESHTLSLSLSTTPWPDCQLTEESLEVSLVKGYNNITFKALSSWITLDYMLFSIK
ncbi:MAG: hypothetical protein LBM99_06455, partial [Bacillales bacterium]|nr:hypothetical protein [Bacillales bacterium]